MGFVRDETSSAAAAIPSSAPFWLHYALISICFTSAAATGARTVAGGGLGGVCVRRRHHSGRCDPNKRDERSTTCCQHTHVLQCQHRAIAAVCSTPCVLAVVLQTSMEACASVASVPLMASVDVDLPFMVLAPPCGRAGVGGVAQAAAAAAAASGGCQGCKTQGRLGLQLSEQHSCILLSAAAGCS